MGGIRRYYVPNSSVFITLVTKNRQHILTKQPAIRTFWDTLTKVQNLHPFDLIAYVILPDHCHLLIQPKDESANFSTIIHSFKRNFTINLKQSLGIEGRYNVWQPRFWDRVIRGDADFQKHLEYIHWNPVKHEYVENPEDWEHSSFKVWSRGYPRENSLPTE